MEKQRRIKMEKRGVNGIKKGKKVWNGKIKKEWNGGK